MASSGPRDVIKLWEDMKATPYPDWMVNPSHSILKMHRIHPITEPYLKLAKAGKTREFLAACRDIFDYPIGSYERDMIGIAMYLGNWWLAKGRYKSAYERTKMSQILAKREREADERAEARTAKLSSVSSDHNASRYTNQGCRCEVCCEANRQRARDYRLRMKAAKAVAA